MKAIIKLHAHFSRSQFRICIIKGKVKALVVVSVSVLVFHQDTVVKQVIVLSGIFFFLDKDINKI